MKVLVTSLLFFILITQLVVAQNDATNGIYKISGIDIIVVEESLNLISYDAELQELRLLSEHANLKIEGWHEDWLIALSGLTEPDEAFETIALSSSNIIMKSQGQFRMSGPFEMIELYTKNADETMLAEDSFVAFIGNDIPLKLTLLPEFEAKISTNSVIEGKLELSWNDQTYLITPNKVTPLANNFCTYLMALNEFETSDITGREISEWRFDMALFKCSE